MYTYIYIYIQYIPYAYYLSIMYITVHHRVRIMIGDHQHASFCESASTNK